MRSSKDEDEMGSELVSLAVDHVQTEQFTSDDQRMDAMDSLHSPVDNGPDSNDFDPVLSSSSVGRGESLNSSLTSGYSKPTSTRLDRWSYWWNDPINKPTVRIIQCIGVSVILFTIILILAAYANHTDDPIDPVPTYVIRLPTTIVPTHYTMVMNASMTTQTFQGDMLITLNVINTTSQILFHSLDLNLDQIWLSIDGTTQIQPSSAGDTGQYDLYAVNFANAIPANTVAQLHIRYSGFILDTRRSGFYLSYYNTSAGEKRAIASTHFEATDARRAFPCFDEPALKAKFEITINTETGFQVLSNMPLKSGNTPINLSPTLQSWQFKSSVRMSSYLVAFCITDFVSKTEYTTRGIPVSVWTAKDKINNVQIALTAGIVSINAYETYFGVNYPLDKMDMIAIPNFAAGAMENWGLVTYRETALLINNASAEASTEQNIVATVAHELAHQWFGNYVTMNWWNDLWLNEGFATFVEWTGVAAYSGKNWDEPAQQILGDQLTAFDLDASQYSHPIVQPVNDPAEVNSLFDRISYDKGSSILMMVADVVGAQFQAGLTQYLNDHAFGNAVSDDLWTALQAHAPPGTEDIPTFMHKFTQQQGYPVVNLSWGDDINTMIATQQRYLLLPYQYQDPSLKDTQASYRWDLYLTVVCDNGESSIWFKSSSPNVTIPWLQSPVDKRCHINSYHHGFYRVNYPLEVWRSLGEYVNSTGEASLSHSDLVGMLDDVWSLCAAGQQNYSAAFAFTQFLSWDVPDYTPWVATFSQLNRIGKLLYNTRKNDYLLFSQYIINGLINNNTLAQLPWEVSHNNLRNMLQASMVAVLVGYNDTNSRTIANNLFINWMKNGEAVANVNIRDSVYRVGIEDGDTDCWNFLYQQYRTTLDATEARRILRALTRTLDTTLLSKLLAWSIDPTSGIKSQDTTRVIIYVSYNRMGRQLAWTFLQNNYKRLYDDYGEESFSWGELLLRVLGNFETQADLTAIQAFFANQPLGTAKQSINIAYETIQTNIYWLQERASEFSEELHKVMGQ